MNIKQIFEKESQKIEEERLNNKGMEYDWDGPRRVFSPVRVAFNKCKTSRKREDLVRMLCEYQAFYNLYNKETKITNKKHHGFIIGNIVNGGFAVICDDAKMRFVKESDVVYL